MRSSVRFCHHRCCHLVRVPYFRVWVVVLLQHRVMGLRVTSGHIVPVEVPPGPGLLPARGSSYKTDPLIRSLVLIQSEPLLPQGSFARPSVQGSSSATHPHSRRASSRGHRVELSLLRGAQPYLRGCAYTYRFSCTPQRLCIPG